MGAVVSRMAESLGLLRRPPR